MNLIRNMRNDGKGKYALIEREKNDHITYGLPYSKDEFFVIKLKDIHSKDALNAYVDSVLGFGVDYEYADQVRELADRAGVDNQWCKHPN